MRTTLTMVTLFVFLLATYLFFTGDQKSTAASGISTGFEASEGYVPGNVDGQNGWEHAQPPGSWQVETNVKNFGTQAIQSPIGFNDTEARATVKSFALQNTGDMVFYMRRDDNNLQSNNFYVGFDTGENSATCVVCMCEEGIIVQNSAGGLAVLANPFTLGQWYKIHFKWDSSTCQASLNDSSFSSPISNPASLGFTRINILARGQAVAYVDDIQDLTPSTELGPAKVWLGLKNSDDVGTKFDLLAEVFSDGTLVGSGQLNAVPGGSSGFNNAVARTINLALFEAVNSSSGDTLSIRLSVRIAVGVTGHRSGTARLWFNDATADSHFDATIGGVSRSYYLTSGSLLSLTPGSGPKNKIDVFVDRAAGGNPFKPFGTWSFTF